MPAYKLHLLFLFSLVIRIGYAFYITDDILVGDAKGYYDNALYLLGQAQNMDFKWVSFWSPGQSLYLLPWMYVFGTTKWVIVSSMLAVWTAFFYIWNKWTTVYLKAETRWFLLFIFSIFPTFIHHSVVPLTHLPATTCMIAVFYFLHQKTFSYSIITGSLFGFLLLLRPSNLLLAALFPFFIKAKKQLLISGVTAIAVVGLWSVYLYQKTDSFIFVSESNGYNLYMGNHPETPEYATWWWATHTWQSGTRLKQESDSLLLLPPGQIGKNFQSLAIHYIKESPIDFLIRTMNRIRCLFTFDTFTGSMLLEKHGKYVALGTIAIDGLLYIGIMTLFILSFLLPRQYHSNIFTFQLISILLISIPYFLSFSHPTYHFSILPIAAIGTGIFWEQGKYFKEFTPPNKWIVVCFLLFFAIIQIEWIYFWINQK